MSTNERLSEGMSSAQNKLWILMSVEMAFSGTLHILLASVTHFNPFTPKSDLIDFTLSNAR